MTISSLLLTLSQDEAARHSALAELASDGRLTLGEPVGGRLPVVLETSSVHDGESAAEALLELHGVAFVDVVAVYFEQEESQ